MPNIYENIKRGSSDTSVTLPPCGSLNNLTYDRAKLIAIHIAPNAIVRESNAKLCFEPSISVMATIVPTKTTALIYSGAFLRKGE